MESHIKPLVASLTKMKHENQLGYKDILVLFFSIKSSLWGKKWVTPEM